MKTAKELMTPKPLVLQSGADVLDALKLFMDHDLHYVPVVTPLNEVLGLFSDFALSKACLINYMTPQHQNKVISHQGLFVEASYVEEDSALDVVMRELSRAPSHRLLVVNKQRKLVGVISPKDVLRLLGGTVKRNADIKNELKKTQEEATRLTKRLDDLNHSFEIYRNLFEDSPNMMHSVDESGTILMANARMHSVLGFNHGELIGQSLSVIYPKTVLHEAIAGLETIKDKGFHHMTYTSMQRKNGEKIRIDITSSALRDHEGQFVGTISVSREVDAEDLLRALNGIVDANPIHK